MANQTVLPSVGYLRLSQIVGDPKTNTPPLIPVCRATIYNWIRDKRFPKPVRLSPAISAWRAEDIRKYIEHGSFSSEPKATIADGKNEAV